MEEDFTIQPYGPHPHHTGIAVPIFALRSKNSSGIGQFSDLKLLADFAHKSDMDVLQLLPINDTITFMDWRDSYPYRAISVFALHPIYLDIHAFLDDYTKLQQTALLEEEEQLNALQQIDYERVLAFKWKYAKLIYDKQATKLKATADYQNFYNKRKDWLLPYACFSYLRDKNKSAEFSSWGTYANYTEDIFEKLSQDKKVADILDLHIFVQYLLHTQLKEAVDYCHSLGVAIKGDIAIGIAHDSVDAWVNPDLFNLDMQAGAPPDVFAVNGQNWGFPTYNWEEMAKDDYAWWKHRMTAMSEYFDAYRLDHILGFFRIWEMPAGSVRGLLGQFSPAIAMSAEEIENNYGIPFRQWSPERFTKPFIKDWVIDEVLGRDNRDYIIQRFLDYVGGGNYQFKPDFDTQRKVEAAGLEDWMRDGLYTLHENVIFVKDRKNEYLYHPRITLMTNTSFREFGNEYKERIERLYNDYFYGRNYDFWKERAYEKLPAIKHATNMLACGEDLGMVPNNVPDVMYRLEILRLIIERMPSDDSFVNGLQYAPYLSVVTTSSHDTSNIRAWWQEDRAVTQRYYNEIMGWYGEAPWEATPEIVQEIIKRHLNSDAMIVALPIQDWLGMSPDLRFADPHQEQINIPAEAFHYWRYRLHLNLEDLNNNTGFTNFLSQFVQDSKRSV
ncbi:4-alpha-glucanotransferase [Lactococcus nasutitermitis]|uniref:4-alpha-glucanotransferase n=1 Tax=Lactococcus nasutitermitis TaxID=1652957 RepID=A0ABV9JDL4_9LACT|nr:4-alpha-glucanotransferase [Lactococcus nasutitermitis]